MKNKILIVAGYDPCGGAGILADVKTAEQHSVYAYAICTGYTFQNSSRISHIHWFSKVAISRQLALCYEEARFDWIKLGIVRDPAMLRNILHNLRKHQPAAKVIWDPVLSASSGPRFMNGLKTEDFEAVLPQVFMITPNLPEVRALYPGATPEDICRRLSKKTIIYLKGGHDEASPGRDRLFIRGDCHALLPGTAKAFPKHGSGCVLSAALAANLAREAGTSFHQPEIPDQVVLTAAIKSKRYTEAFLNSDPGLLGWHQHLKND